MTVTGRVGIMNAKLGEREGRHNRIDRPSIATAHFTILKQQGDEMESDAPSTLKKIGIQFTHA